ncbi:fimbrial protein [Arsenophonus sp.]|uniref:fimbrial protein n=1 Tax=Arsenophonus sp. TaxID=1872640 RepID=UPI00387A31DB
MINELFLFSHNYRLSRTQVILIPYILYFTQLKEKTIIISILKYLLFKIKITVFLKRKKAMIFLFKKEKVKTMRNLLMTSFLSIFYLTQFTAHASDRNIKFTGEIIQSSCTFKALTKDQTVSLGTVATNSFKKVHDTASPTVFNIEINNCPNNSQEVFVIFDGVKDEINNELLAIKEGDGYAAGVAI